jgi:hypothetical protein
MKMQKMLFIENKAYFFKRFHFISWKIDPFLHKPKYKTTTTIDTLFIAIKLR